MKKAHEYWYYFGKCTPYPMQIKEGTLPRFPYFRFDTKEECQDHINTKGPFNAFKMMAEKGL